MENIEVKKRESNFELLRILAMVMIVISHFAAHGGFDFPNTEISINRLWIQLCGAFSESSCGKMSHTRCCWYELISSLKS